MLELSMNNNLATFNRPELDERKHVAKGGILKTLTIYYLRSQQLPSVNNNKISTNNNNPLTSWTDTRFRFNCFGANKIELPIVRMIAYKRLTVNELKQQEPIFCSLPNYYSALNIIERFRTANKLATTVYSFHKSELVLLESFKRLMLFRKMALRSVLAKTHQGTTIITGVYLTTRRYVY